MSQNALKIENMTPEMKVISSPASSAPEWRKYINSLIAAEISSASRYFDVLFHLPRPDETSVLFDLVDNNNKFSVENLEKLLSKLSLISEDKEKSKSSSHVAVLLNGIFNHEHDIEGFLRSLWKNLSRHSRIFAVAYNPYLRGIYSLANKLGIRKGEVPSTFVTATDLSNIAKLAGFEVVRVRPVGFIPWKLFGVGTALNSFLASVPVIRLFSLSWVVILRPIKPSEEKPSLTIVIPARNEKGNMEAALERMPDLGVSPEIIFVEGHSTDGTWEEIQRVQEKYKDKYNIKIFQQTGKGKADAVRLGFSHATSELLTILDADLTMPPELLGRFYEAWNKGLADFVNGNRLVYPMEGEAMKFLNWLGNIFFAKALSAVLDTKLGDSLCGTKLLSKKDYERFIAWRKDFGDFDPFGDFELLFPACTLGLGIVDVPIRYRDRVYGTTNIRRFYHGLMLLKMTLIGYLRIKLGRYPDKSK